MMNKAVIGIVETRAEAETLIERLQAGGFGSKDLSVLFPDTNGSQTFAYEHNTKAPEGATAGVGIGGVIGGTLGVLAGIGALAIPGLGPFIAAGPIMAGLSGLAAGAAVGGISGALVGLGIPEYEAKMYEDRLKAGNILVSTHVQNDTERKTALDIFKATGVKHVNTQTEKTGTPA